MPPLREVVKEVVKRSRPLVFAAAALLSGTGCEAAASEATLPGADRIATRTLANGFKIVVWTDGRIPNVAISTWYRVGSRNERAGLTGISHFFEHMMFNGTSTRGPGEFDRVMEANGGSNNAYTSEDVTVYQDWFPGSATELIFDLEADRMRHLVFEAKAVESERGVVYSERRSSVDNDNFGTLEEQTRAAAFLAHPYHNPVLGWPSDIESWKVADLEDYYRRFYAPNNAVMFVAGDVSAQEVFRLADKYFADIEAQPAPEPVRTREPPQRGERRVRIVREAQTPLLQMAWHAPAAPDREARVMEVLLSILGDGEASRLHQRLVEKEQAAVEIGTSLDQGFDPGLAWLYAVVPPGSDVGRAERLIDEEIARMARAGPTAAELARARNQALAGFWHGLETISGKAAALGRYEIFHGDYHRLFDAPGVYDSITAAEVKRAAATVLRVDNRTVGILESPPGERAGQRRPGSAR